MHEKISFLRFHLQDWDKPPRDVIKPYWPDSFNQYAWIPQTMGDQVWVMYEFFSEADRVNWEFTLPKHIHACLDRSTIPHALKYGWHSRDPNGFY